MSSTRVRPARTTARAVAPGANAVLYATAGRRSALRYLLFWHTLRLSAQWCIDHPRLAGWWTLGLLAFGLTSDLVLVLSGATAIAWALLARERKDAPRWAPPSGLKPWHRPIQANTTTYFRNALDPRRCYVLAAAAAVLQPLLAYALHPTLLLLVAAAHMYGVVKLRVPPDRDPRWHSEAQLLGLLTDPHVAVLRATPAVPGRPSVPPWLSRSPDGLRVDERGEHVTVTLSGAATWRSVLAKRHEIASFWDLPAERVGIDHRPGWPEGMVTLSQLREREPVAVGGLSPVALATNTDAAAPVEVGTDEETGERLTLQLEETNDLDSGVMGAGKTEGSRPVLATILGDDRPRAHGQRGAWLFGMDGKGSRKDYKRVARLAERWVWGDADDAPQQLVSMLRLVHRIVVWRNVVDEDGDLDWPMVQVWLEEFQDVRDAAEPDEQREIDRLMRRIMRKGRAVRVRVRVLTQRASVDDLPSGYRNLFVNRTAYRQGQAADYRLALGTTGPVECRLPTAEHGEAVLRRFGSVRPLAVDRFPLPEWNRFLDNVAERRQGRPAPVYCDDLPPTLASTLADARDDDEPTLTPPTPAAPTPPLVAACLTALADGPLQATALNDRLPPDLRAKDGTDLGKTLRAYPRYLRRARHGKSMAWHPLTPVSTEETA